MPLVFVSLRDAAEVLGLAASTLRHQIRLGRIKATKIGRGWFVTPEEITRYQGESLRQR